MADLKRTWVKDGYSTKKGTTTHTVYGEDDSGNVKKVKSGFYGKTGLAAAQKHSDKFNRARSKQEAEDGLDNMFRSRLRKSED